MSMSKLVSVIVSLSFSHLVFAEQVCKTEVSIENALFRPAPSNRDDIMAKRLAQFLKQKSQNLNCVDLRSLGGSFRSSSNPPSLSIDERVGLLSTKQLSANDVRDLKKFLCEGASPSCRADITVNCVPNSSLGLAHDLRQGRAGASTDGLRRGEERTASIGNINRMPRFSNACETGSREDSWNNTASTAAARQLLTDSGLVIDDIRSLRLTSDNGEFWSFGFINHETNSNPQVSPRPAPRPTGGSSRGVDL